jgi:serine/threonine protein phosphatase PrpC
LSYDHKPEDEDEERRIREAGGFVSGGRVEGDLAVSRGLGDFRFKDMHVVLSGSRGENRDRREVTFGNNDSHDDADEVVDAIPLPACKPSEQKVSPVPDIIVQNRDGDEDEFVVIACDGIWDVQTNQECVQMVADIFSEGESDIGLVCEEVSLEK